jgi:hypothetical protein
MPNELGPHLEQRIIAFALAHPGLGPKRIAAELRREKWGGLVISPNGVSRVLRRRGLNTRTRRLSLVAGYQARYERSPLPSQPRHVEASRPGQLVGLDCFYVGRLSGTKGAVWQYTAIDVASSFAWAELHATPKNPAAEHCRSLPLRPRGRLRDVAPEAAHQLAEGVDRPAHRAWRRRFRRHPQRPGRCARRRYRRSVHGVARRRVAA